MMPIAFTNEQLDAITGCFEVVTVDGTPGGVTFTAARCLDDEFGPARAAFISVEEAPVRYTVCGTTPYPDTGHLLTPGSSFVLWGTKNIRMFRAIATTLTSGKLMVTFYR